MPGSAPGTDKFSPLPRSCNRPALLATGSLLLLAIFLVFGQTVRHGFVNYDDDQYVYENPPVNLGLTVQGAAWAFAQHHASNWHPLTWVSHMLDCQPAEAVGASIPHNRYSRCNQAGDSYSADELSLRGSA